jgi:hypothetical protein
MAFARSGVLSVGDVHADGDLSWRYLGGQVGLALAGQKTNRNGART